MLNKALFSWKLTRVWQQQQHHAQKRGAGAVVEGSMPLKIIHPGGSFDQYYMAVPAVKIMEEYPSFIVARPEVLDPVVDPEEILFPGEKFFIVPCRTVQKLRRNIGKPSGDMPINSPDYFPSKDVSPLLGETSEKSGNGNGDGDENPRRMAQNPKRNGSTWQPALTAIRESSNE